MSSGSEKAPEATRLDSARFAYSESFARAQLGLTPILLLLPLALIAISLYLLVERDDWFVGLGGIAAALWMLAIAWQWVRYRHALREQYVIDRYGVRVDSPLGTKQIPWEDFDRAEHLVIPDMLRLIAKTRESPVFLFLDRRAFRSREDQGRNQVARRLVKASMKNRYHRRWL